jgi:glycosyltransferase involved in cell wall biosynthesis
MKVLLLNAWDNKGGAARAARRLLLGERQLGLDARMLVKEKTCSDDCIIGPRTRVDRFLAFLRPIFEYYRIRRYPGWNRLSFSPALFPDRLLGQVHVINPDIIHLHWMGDGFLRVETLPRFKQPLVWTLHDSWVFTGGCHIPFDCRRYRKSCGVCPALGSEREEDLSRKVWRRKHKAWQTLDVTVVSPSRWLADCARSSSLLGDKRIEVIPNGLDLHRFKPIEKDFAREALSLHKNRSLILFGGVNSTSDRNKGFHLLQTALGKLAADGWGRTAELLVFGTSRVGSSLDSGLKANYLGWLHDDISISLLYAAADVFVMPSIQENLPNTILEAMACGTPCVAFRQGGVPDMVEHERNGYLAEPFEADDLARGIAWVLENEDRRRSLAIRAQQKVEGEFSLDHVAKRYATLYAELQGKEL